MEKKRRLMCTGPVLDIISIWPQAWCSSEVAVVKVEAAFFCNSRAVYLKQLCTYDSYSFNQNFDNLRFEANLQTARCSLRHDGCHLKGSFDPLSVWHQQKVMCFEEQSSSKAPRVTQWAWVSLSTFFSFRHASKHSHVLSLIQTHTPLHPPSSCMLTPLCPPRPDRCSRRRCRCLLPELSPSPGCCNRRSSGTQTSAGSAASPPPSAPAASGRSLVEGTRTRMEDASKYYAQYTHTWVSNKYFNYW